MKPTIELWESVEFGAILEFPSGVLYSNQTGGTSCLHPKYEGVYVPLRNDASRDDWQLLSPSRELRRYFEGPKHGRAGAVRGLDADDADFIDGVLTRYALEAFRVDRRIMSASHESWVHALVVSPAHGQLQVFSGFEPFPRRAILTWSNSD